MNLWPFGKKTIDLDDVTAGKVQITRHGRPLSVRGYNAAKHNRLTLGWTPSSGDANAVASSDLGVLRKRARDLTINNDYAKGARTVIVDNVVGKSPGIQLSPQLKNHKGELRRDLNEQIRQLWFRWGKSKYCHAARTCSFPMLQRQILEEVIDGGEVFIKKITGYENAVKVPLQLEILEAEYCPIELNGTSEYGNRIVQGVEINQFGAPVAYHLYRRHPGDPYNSDRRTIRVTADKIIHVKLPGRAGQVRGVPWMATTMLRLNDLGGMEQATLTRARASAGVMGIVKTEDGSLPTDPDGKAYLDADPGSIVVMGAEDEVDFWDPKFPDAALETFLVTMLRGAAAGLGMSYETLARDHSKSNYSSTRVGQLGERIGFAVIQEWLGECVLAPVYEEFLKMAHVAGALFIPEFADRSNPDGVVDAAYWMPPGWDWVDPLKEIQADALAVEKGFKTLADIHAKRGGDFDDWLQTTKNEIEALREIGAVHPLLVAQKVTITERPASDEEDDLEETDRRRGAVPFRVLRGH